MTHPTCSQLIIQLQEIKSLKTKLDLELPKIKDTRNTAPALELEKEIREKIDLIKEVEPIKEILCGKFFRKIAEAQEIFGHNFLGPEAIEKTFGVKLKVEDIPDIPLSVEALKRANNLGFFLILRTAKTADDEPLTAQEMVTSVTAKWEKEGRDTSLLSSDNLNTLKSMEFFMADTPDLSWALVAKDAVPKSSRGNYVDQISASILYLRNKLFKGLKLPEGYIEAIDEFESQKDRLEKLIKEDGSKAARRLVELKIVKLTRQTVSEAIYDVAMYYDQNNEELLSDTCIWLRSLYPSERIAFLGKSDQQSLSFGGNRPNNRDEYVDKLGTILSCKL